MNRKERRLINQSRCLENYVTQILRKTGLTQKEAEDAARINLQLPEPQEQNTSPAAPPKT